MALTAGIVGLPNVGKSTLFNAITKAGAEAANYPFATIDPNVGMVEVPDERLQKLTEMITPKKTVPTTFEFTDIAGIVKGASKGEGLGNKFLANIREVDAIVHVVRAFDDENVMREQGREDAFVDPLADIDTINLELILADLESVNKRYARVEKMARTQKDKESVAEFNVLQKIKPVLEDGKSARTIEFTDEEQKVVKGLFLLTTKPVLYVANVDEDVVSEPDSIDYVKQIREFAATENAEVVVISARAEEEISELDEEDKQEFLEDLKRYKMIKMDNDGMGDQSGVTTIAIDIPTEARNLILERTKKQIFISGQGVNPETDKLGNSSGVALKFLYSLLELKAGNMETQFRSGYATLVKMILKHLGLSDKLKIKQTWTRNSINNDTEMAQVVSTLATITSRENVAKSNPIVEDWQDELRLQKAEQEERPEKAYDMEELEHESEAE